MPNYQGTLFLGDTGGTLGWSEPYYLAAADAESAQTALKAIADARVIVLPTTYQVTAGRISDVAILNDSLLIADTPLPGARAVGPPAQNDAWSALLLRVEATSLHRGRHFIHGVCEVDFLPDRSFDPLGPFVAQWTTFVNFLKANTLLRIDVLGTPSYEVITNVIPQRLVEKKVGRPFNLLRGRRVI